MGTRGGWLGARRVGTLAAFVAFVAVASCLDPTEVTLVLTTDLPCNQLNGTSITVGGAGDIESKSPVTETSACTPGPGGDQAIGTFVVVPSQGSSEAFAVRVVSGVDKPVVDCNKGDNYQGCIVERRELAFLPHTPLTLPIAMNLDCLNVSCLAHQTCNHGQCVSAVIPDPHTCTGAGCGADALAPLESGSSPADGPAETSLVDNPGTGALPDGTAADMGAPDATPDVTGSDTTVTDGAPADMTVVDSPGMDAPPDGPGSDAPSGDAPADVVAEAPGPDASPEAGMDASADATSSDSGGPTDGSPPGDGSPLGNCPTVNTTHVACGGTACATGQVCCVAVTSGSPSESCTSPAACNTAFVGSTVYSSLACRNRGDCPSGTVCCADPDTVGGSFTTTCVASCPSMINQKQACRNTCECGAGACTVVVPFTCGYLNLATCGGACP